MNLSLEPPPCTWGLHWRDQQHLNSSAEGPKVLCLLTSLHPTQTAFIDSRGRHLDVVNTWAVWT